MQQSISTPAAALERRRLVTPATALYSPEFLGLPLPSKPDQAAGLRIARRRFPLPTVLVDGRRMVLVADIDVYINGLSTVPPASSPPELTTRRRRGRPSKAEVAARHAAAALEAGHD